MKSPLSLRNDLFLTIGLIIKICVICCSHCSAIELPPSEKLLPPETVFIVDVPVFQKLQNNFKKTNLYNLYKDPLMAPFVNEAKSKWQKNVKQLDENNILRALIESEIYPKGRLTLAFVDSKDNPDANEPPLMFIGQWGQDIKKVKEKVAKAIEKNTQMGGRNLEPVKFQGVKIEQAIDENGLKYGYFFIDDSFVGGISIETLKFIIAHIKGATSPALANDKYYIETSKALGMQNDVTAYINISYLIKKELETDTNGGLRAYFNNLGVDKIGGLGAAMMMGRTPLEQIKIKILLKVNGGKTGILKAIEPQTGALNVPDFIPADTASVSLLNLDTKKCFDEMIKVLTLFNPATASFLYSPVTGPANDGTPGVTIKADIIDHLATGVVVFQSLNKPFSQKTLPSDYLVAVAISNRNAIERSLSQIHSRMIAPNDPDAKKDFLGYTVYIMKLGAMPFFKQKNVEPLQQLNETPGSKPEIPNVAFTITDTHFMLGFQNSIENTIRTLKSSENIKNQRWFNQARASLPAKTGLASLDDIRQKGEFLWWLLKKSSDNSLGAGMSAPTASYLIDNADLDFSLLPEYDKIKKYLGTNVFHLISREDGFYAESKLIDQR